MKLVQILLLIAAVAIGFVAPDLITSITQDERQIDVDKYCFISTEPCRQSDVSMQLEHDIAKPLVPSNIEVNWENASGNTLQLSLEGLEMEMGVAKYQLSKQSNGMFTGTIMLPVCTQDNMTWLGTLTDGTKEVYPAIRMER